jgi:pectate lyase
MNLKTRILIMAMALLGFGLMAAARSAQDTMGFIRMLQSRDPRQVEAGRDGLLKRGPDALPTLRDALSRSKDTAFRQSLTEIIERLQARAAVRQLAARWGERWYSMRHRGVKVGWLRLKVEEKDGMIVMSDELYYTNNGQEARTLHTITSRMDEYLSPVSLSLEVIRPDKPWTIQADVRGGVLILRSKNPASGEREGGRLKPDFTTEFAVMRLVTLIPKTKRYGISLLEMWEKPAIQEAILKFDREEPLDFEGRKVKAARFTLSNPNSADRTYWVDETGRLIKMRVYGRIEFVLTDEKIAKNIVKSVRTEEPSRRPLAAQTPVVESRLPVFPGAEGFGSRTRAGRGGKVIEVTSLADSGRGTLRAALADPNPRIIVFRVGGTIEARQPLAIDHPFVTVAGQTAPGGGILIKNVGLNVTTHDVLIQHLRIRPGNEGSVDPEVNDAIQIDGASNVVIDHVSASWGEDEIVQTWFRAHDVTFSWCLISEALDKSRHPKGRHGAGFLIGDGSDRISVHHCLLAHNDFRNPLISRSGTVDLVENVIYNWGRTAGEIYHDRKSTATTQVNVVGNLYIRGSSSQPEVPEIALNFEPRGGTAPPRIYARDNLGPRRPSNGLDEFFLFSLGWGGKRLPDANRSGKPFDTRKISRLSQPSLLDVVMARTGATRPHRDAVDRRVVESLRRKKGRLINSPMEAGGYPAIKGGKPPVDSDHDGMPDEWEIKRALDPHNASDAAKDRNGEGYTNIEEYLHSLSGLESVTIPGSTRSRREDKQR